MRNRAIAYSTSGGVMTASDLSNRELLEITAGAPNWSWNPEANADRDMTLLRVNVELTARALGLSTK